MTKKLEEQLYTSGQKIGLTFNEREAMRAQLLSSIVNSEQKIVSPYSPIFYWRFVSAYVKPQYVSIALLTVLVIGGVSFEAEKALPGEPLYQVKTSVNENVLAMFAFTPQSKAQLHTELAVRRLEEVENLAIAGKLDASTTAQAVSNINGNLAVVKDNVKQLENENNNTAAANTSSQAESSLKVHEAILNTLADGNTSVQDVATQVGIQATALSLDMAGMDSKNASTTLSIDVLLDQQKVTQDAITFLQSDLATTTATTTVNLNILNVASSTSLLATSTATTTATSTMATSTSVVTSAQVKLQQASDLLAQGSNKLDAKDYGDAFVLFKKAEQTAVDARQILEGINLSGAISTSTATSTTATSTTATSTSSVL